MTEWTVAALGVSMALSLALMGVLRPLMRRGFGPRAQYCSWLLVPAFTVATLLPAPPVPLPLVAPQASRVVSEAHRLAVDWIWRAPPGQGAASGTAPRPPGLPWPIWAWAAGLVVLAGAVAWQHGRWRRQLTWDGASGHWQLPAGCSPSVVGLFRPRLALPVDFERRFSPEERAAVLAHEDVHAQRRDNLWNLLATAFWVLNWFNPLAWWALRAFQRDQELACDAAALSRQGEAARGAYRDALLKAFQISPSSALSRGWRSTHPLIERLAWVQAGFVEKTWLSAVVVTLALLGLSGLAYAVHGGGMWQVWSPRSTPLPGQAMARVETLSQINGGPWARAVDEVSVGHWSRAEQVVTWTETLDGRKVYTVMLNVTRAQGEEPSARVQLAEILDPALAAGGAVPEVQYADIPASLWHQAELRTRAGDLVRLRVRFEMLGAAAPASP